MKWDEVIAKYPSEELNTMILKNYIADPEKGLSGMAEQWQVSTPVLSKRLQKAATKARNTDTKLYKQYKNAYRIQRTLISTENYTREWVKMLLENNRIQLAEKIVDIYLADGKPDGICKISGMQWHSLKAGYIKPYLDSITPSKAVAYSELARGKTRRQMNQGAANNIVSVMLHYKDLFMNLPEEIEYTEFVDLLVAQDIRASVLECLYAAKEFNCKVVRNDKYIHNRWENEGGWLEWRLGLGEDGRKYLRAKAYRSISSI